MATMLPRALRVGNRGIANISPRTGGLSPAKKLTHMNRPFLTEATHARFVIEATRTKASHSLLLIDSVRNAVLFSVPSS